MKHFNCLTHCIKLTKILKIVISVYINICVSTALVYVIIITWFSNEIPYIQIEFQTYN